jgi:hypothetical protein
VAPEYTNSQHSSNSYSMCAIKPCYLMKVYNIITERTWVKQTLPEANDCPLQNLPCCLRHIVYIFVEFSIWLPSRLADFPIFTLPLRPLMRFGLTYKNFSPTYCMTSKPLVAPKPTSIHLPLDICRSMESASSQLYELDFVADILQPLQFIVWGELVLGHLGVPTVLHVRVSSS